MTLYQDFCLSVTAFWQHPKTVLFDSNAQWELLNKHNRSDGSGIPFTVATEIEDRLLWDAFSDVNMIAQTGDTHIGRIGFNHTATLITHAVTQYTNHIGKLQLCSCINCACTVFLCFICCLFRSFAKFAFYNHPLSRVMVKCRCAGMRVCEHYVGYFADKICEYDLQICRLTASNTPRRSTTKGSFI